MRWHSDHSHSMTALQFHGIPSLQRSDRRRLPFLFVQRVYDTAGIYDCSALWSQSSQRRAFALRNSSLCLILCPEQNSVLCTFSRFVNDNREAVKIDDFATFNVPNEEIWRSVELSDRNVSMFEVNRANETSLNASFIECVRRILAERRCTWFYCKLAPQNAWFMDTLLPAMPLTFRTLTFTSGSACAEKFILETRNFQMIENLELGGSFWPQSTALTDFVIERALSTTVSTIYLQPFTFAFSMFDRILENWIANPGSFKNNDICMTMPLAFEPNRLEKFLSPCKANLEDDKEEVVFCKHDLEKGIYAKVMCYRQLGVVRMHLARKGKTLYRLLNRNCEEAGCF